MQLLLQWMANCDSGNRLRRVVMDPPQSFNGIVDPYQTVKVMDCRYCLSSSWCNKLRVYNHLNGQHLLDSAGSSMHSLSFSSDGTLLATGTAGSICLWNVETGALISRLPSPFSCEVQFQYIAFIHGTPHLAGSQQMQLLPFSQYGVSGPA